jgi:hypothetical protein
MKFSLFNRHARPSAATEPGWRERESALLWGVPLVLFSALAWIPITISLMVEPAFHHARIVGLVLLALLGWCFARGVSRLALCFRRDFDVLSLLAGGTVVVLVVISMCAGVILASVIGN